MNIGECKVSITTFAASMLTSVGKEKIGKLVGCDPTIRLDCNLIALVRSNFKPLIYSFRVIHSFISCLALEIVFKSSSVFANHEMSESSDRCFAKHQNISNDINRDGGSFLGARATQVKVNTIKALFE